MFEIDFSFFICYYLFGLGLVFFTAWVWSRPKQKPVRSARELVWQCPICSYVYFDSGSKRISACPLCGSLNERSAKQGG